MSAVPPIAPEFVRWTKLIAPVEATRRRARRDARSRRKLLIIHACLPSFTVEEMYERITRPVSGCLLPREYVEAVQREEGLPLHVREGLQRARLDRLRRGGLP